MKNLLKILGAMALVSAASALQAQEMARVVSSTPVMQQVTVPRQVCTETPVVVQRQRSGAGAVVGALAGGIIGSQVGRGSGQGAATAIGMIGGAILGDQIEGDPAPVVRTANSCTQQVTYENRVVGYTVVYEYAGRQYTAQMNSDPGSSLPIQITPTASQAEIYTTPAPPAPVIVQPPVQVRTYPPVIVTPVYRPPVYYSPPVYGPPAVNFRWGYASHPGRGQHHGYGRSDEGYPGRWR